jgi:uncharacterized membrane protein (UPF0127 family)
MSLLFNKSKNAVVASHLEEAKTFVARSRGLLGRSNLPKGHALWIHQCSSVHTWFMKFAIDVIFLDRNMKVKSIHRNVKPGRIVFPFIGAASVIEMEAGQLHSELVEKGDDLDVRH